MKTKEGYYVGEGSSGFEGVKKAVDCLQKAGVISKKYEIEIVDGTHDDRLLQKIDRIEQIFLTEKNGVRDDLKLNGVGKATSGKDVHFRMTSNVPYGKREAAQECMK